MSTFLELCNDVARESGTFKDIPAFATMNGVTGRGLRVKNWVASAYRDIQISNNGWRFLMADFSGETLNGVREYNAAALGIDTRFRRWVQHDHDGQQTTTIYKTSNGAAFEVPLRFIDWSNFRVQALTGPAAAQTGQPTAYSIDNQDRIVLFPTPDDAYTLRGVYMKSPQMLSSDAEVPELPETFHPIITYRALLKLGVFDESPEQMPIWEAEMKLLYGQLAIEQLPPIRLQGPLI